MSNLESKVIKTSEFGDIVIVKDDYAGDCEMCVQEDQDSCDAFEERYNLGDCVHGHHYERYIPPEKSISKGDNDIVTFPGIDGGYRVVKDLHCSGCCFYSTLEQACSLQIKSLCKANLSGGYTRVDQSNNNIIKTINLGDHLGLVDVVKGGGCGDCYLFGLYNNCTYGNCGRFELCKRVTGLDCTKLSGFDGHLIKHKVPKTEEWIQCTPDNICVGDVVRSNYLESPFGSIIAVYNGGLYVLTSSKDDQVFKTGDLEKLLTPSD